MNNTKQRILNVALDLFSQKGFSAASIRDICKVVDIKESSVYYHFKNKLAIFDELLQHFETLATDLMLGSLPPLCYPCQREARKLFSFTFSSITHSGKSEKCTDVAGVRPGIKFAERYNSCKWKWRCFYMGNPNLLPYETIVRATSGEPEAVNEVLRHYGNQIRLAALENGHINQDTEDSIKQRLITALFQFRFDEQ